MYIHGGQHGRRACRCSGGNPNPLKPWEVPSPCLSQRPGMAVCSSPQALTPQTSFILDVSAYVVPEGPQGPFQGQRTSKDPQGHHKDLQGPPKTFERLPRTHQAPTKNFQGLPKNLQTPQEQIAFQRLHGIPNGPTTATQAPPMTPKECKILQAHPCDPQGPC